MRPIFSTICEHTGHKVEIKYEAPFYVVRLKGETVVSEQHKIDADNAARITLEVLSIIGA